MRQSSERRIAAATSTTQSGGREHEALRETYARCAGRVAGAARAGPGRHPAHRATRRDAVVHRRGKQLHHACPGCSQRALGGLTGRRRHHDPDPVRGGGGCRDRRGAGPGGGGRDRSRARDERSPRTRRLHRRAGRHAVPYRRRERRVGRTAGVDERARRRRAAARRNGAEAPNLGAPGRGRAGSLSRAAGSAGRGATSGPSDTDRAADRRGRVWARRLAVAGRGGRVAGERVPERRRVVGQRPRRDADPAGHVELDPAAAGGAPRSTRTRPSTTSPPASCTCAS